MVVVGHSLLLSAGDGVVVLSQRTASSSKRVGEPELASLRLGASSSRWRAA